MTRLALRPHSSSGPAVAIEAEALWLGPTTVALFYRVTGDLGSLSLSPPLAAPRRMDGLWRHTCFEAFLSAPGEELYLELNLAPSGEWAAYRFDSYRSGMAEAALPAPRIETRMEDRLFELSARIRGLGHHAYRLGLSAVLETEVGKLSYWALAHPPGKPDFHHPDCFAFDLPPPERP